MKSEERARKLEAYGKAYNVLVEALKRYPKEMWKFRDEHGCWSIHEHIVHMTDAEANSYVWYRSLVVQPGHDLSAYFEDEWAKTLSYQDQSTEHALVLFKLLRKQNHTLLKTLPEDVWSNVARHPQYGDVNLGGLFNFSASHVDEHVQFMQENYDAWMGRKE